MTPPFPERFDAPVQDAVPAAPTLNPAAQPLPPSTPAERLRTIEERRRQVHAEFARLDRAFSAGTLSFDEYVFYIKKVHGGKLEHELLRDLEYEERALRDEMGGRVDEGRPIVTTVTAALALLLIVSLGLFAAFGHLALGPTGLVTLTPTQSVAMPSSFVFTASGSAPLNVTNTSSFQVTGSLTGGTASAYLVVDGQRHLVYQGDASPGASVVTSMASYALNETVNVTVLPAGADYTLWLTDENGVKQPVFEPFSLAVPGAYTLDALLNDSGNISKVSTSFLVRNDTNATNDVPTSGTTANMITFNDACVDTCTLNDTGNATLALEVTLGDGATLNITGITTTEPRTNRAPVQTATVPDVTLQQGASTTLDLGAYFLDPDNDSLTYDYMNVPDATITFNGSTATITGTAAGSEQSILYASDLYSITPSNQFTITVTASNATTNGTINGTTIENGTSTTITNENLTNTTTNESTTITTNGTVNGTGNETNGTITDGTVIPNETNATNATLDCSNPDPNQQPAACLLLNASQYFPDQEILLQNLDRTPVARFTEIGNLLIGGRVYERSTGAPGPRDFRIGYVDRDGNSVATIWIDSATGDLHLLGMLHEENANLAPTPGSYSLINKRSVYLAYADQYTGDLYVRGNVIPYRFAGVSG